MGIKDFFNNISSINSQLDSLENNKNKMAANSGHNFGYNLNSGEKGNSNLNPVRRMRFNRTALILRSRESEFQNTTYASVIYWLSTYVIGTGLSLSCNPVWNILNIDDVSEQKKIKKEIEQYLKLIMSSNALDFYGEENSDKLLRTIFNQYLIDGDIFILLSYHNKSDPFCPVKIRFIASENVRSGSSSSGIKNCHEGIELDDDGKVVAYHIAKDDNFDSSTFRISVGETVRIPRYTENNQEQVLHIKNKFMPNDLRGIPLSAHILHELENVTEAIVNELHAMKVNAATLGVIERSNSNVAPGSIIPMQQSKQKEENQNPKEMDIFDTPGVVFNGLNAGEKFVELSTNRPNLSLTSFVDAVIKPMVASMGITPEILHGQYMSNYSASRAAIQQFWRSIMVYRQDFSRSLYRSIYEAIITEQVHAGIFKLEGFFETDIKKVAWLNHSWIGGTQPSLDPNKDIEAAMKSIAAGLSTRTKAAKELNGSNFDENIEGLGIEEELMNNTIPNRNIENENTNQKNDGGN